MQNVIVLTQINAATNRSNCWRFALLESIDTRGVYISLFQTLYVTFSKHLVNKMKWNEMKQTQVHTIAMKYGHNFLNALSMVFSICHEWRCVCAPVSVGRVCALWRRYVPILPVVKLALFFRHNFWMKTSIV